MKMDVSSSDRQVFLVGGGIASLAAAAFMIRDGDILGQNITILEESNTLGGSLDGSGSPEKGYLLRGGRMLERKYLCTFDLFSSIPTLYGTKTVTQEIFDWNEVLKTSSQARLFRKGRRQVAPPFGLSSPPSLSRTSLTSWGNLPTSACSGVTVSMSTWTAIS